MLAPYTNYSECYAVILPICCPFIAAEEKPWISSLQNILDMEGVVVGIRPSSLPSLPSSLLLPLPCRDAIA